MCKTAPRSRTTVTCVELLLKAEADVNTRSKHGSAVISNAAVSGCSGKLKLLIEAGADVNATRPYRTTALHEVVSIHNWVVKNENYYKKAFQ